MESFLVFILSIFVFWGIWYDVKYNIHKSAEKLSFTQKFLVILLMALTMAKTIGGHIFSKQIVSLSSIALMIVCFAHLFANKKKTEINLNIVVLLMYLAFNIFVCNPDPIYMAWPRLLLFIVVLSIASPLFASRNAIHFRRYCITWGLLFCIAISVVSFFCYFLGINLMTNEGEYLEDYERIGGHFSGVTNQSMMLGPIAGISVLSLLCNFFRFKSNKKKWALLIMCAGALLFSASRSSVVATLGGMICVLLILRNRDKRFVRKTVTAIIVLLLLFPLWDSALDGIKQKNISRADSGRFESRTGKFEGRLREFYGSPIIGIGYGVIRIARLSSTEQVSIEPGSSWLGILSMTGIIGFIIFFILFFKCWDIVRKKEFDIQRRAFLLGLLTFFAINMIFEGYIYAGGSPLCFMIWLVLGVSHDCKFSQKPMIPQIIKEKR